MLTTLVTPSPRGARLTNAKAPCGDGEVSALVVSERAGEQKKLKAPIYQFGTRTFIMDGKVSQVSHSFMHQNDRWAAVPTQMTHTNVWFVRTC